MKQVAKRRLTLNGLGGVILQMIELFTSTKTTEEAKTQTVLAPVKKKKK
jgi:hypothetical protein